MRSLILRKPPQGARGRQVLCVTNTEQAAREYAAAAGVLFPENDYSIRAAQAKGREEELVRVKVMKNAGIIKKPVFLSIRAFLGKLVPKKNLTDLPAD